MSETSLLDLPLLEAAQAQKHVTHNEALLKLDAVVQLAVVTRQLAVPPGSPVEGDRYLIASGATGAWTAHAGDIATSQSGAWVFAVPRAGWRLWVQDEEKLLVFTGTVWKDVNAISALQNLSLLGVNTSADTGNRLAVASPAVLFNHAGGDQRVKVNKQAAGDTASLLYQTDFSGRAEMGLAGDDNFHFKVSPNGASWTEAIVIDRTTGVVTMPATPSPGISDGDKGDITVSGSGTAWSLDTSVIDNRYIAVFANGLAVKAYGMVADFGAGNTDNTAAMQAAITAALSSGAKTILRSEERRVGKECRL